MSSRYSEYFTLKSKCMVQTKIKCLFITPAHREDLSSSFTNCAHKAADRAHPPGQKV